jgi:galactokinase
VVSLPAADQPALGGWGRLVQETAAVATVGFTGRATTDLPVGAGLASSASFEVALALAFGHPGPALDLARFCQSAEQRATGVPCGIMDQLAAAAGVVGHALLIDCAELSVEPVLVPPDAEIVVVDSGQSRRLAGSAYADRRRACEEAEALIGPLRTATLDRLAAIPDAGLRARARHVVSENGRVRDFAAAMAAGDLGACGRLMGESHRSLAADFEVSTPRLDQLVADLCDRPDVFGARLTGAGFGGCVVALARPGAVRDGWPVVASDGARVAVSLTRGAGPPHPPSAGSGRPLS